MNALFGNRTEAGMALAELAREYAGSNTIVLGLSMGGTLVAAELADWLGAAVDFLPLRTLVLPCDERTTIGAVGPAGFCVFEDEIIDMLDIESDALGTLRCEAEAALTQENHSLRGGRPFPNVRNQTVILVDDFIVSTLKVRAAILSLHQQQPRIVVVAAPVIVKSVLRDLRAFVPAMAAVEEPESAPNIGRIYADAPTPSDAEVRRVLGVRDPADEMPVGSPTDDA